MIDKKLARYLYGVISGNKPESKPEQVYSEPWKSIAEDLEHVDVRHREFSFERKIKDLKLSRVATLDIIKKVMVYKPVFSEVYNALDMHRESPIQSWWVSRSNISRCRLCHPPADEQNVISNSVVNSENLEWDPKTKEAIGWFKKYRNILPYKPFKINSVTTVEEPELLYSSIERNIANGPSDYCARKGIILQYIAKIKRAYLQSR